MRDADRIAAALERIAAALENRNEVEDPLAAMGKMFGATFDPPRPMPTGDEGEDPGVEPSDDTAIMTETIDLPFEGYKVYFEANDRAPEGFVLGLIVPGGATYALSWSG
jgi:hypothetical protein